MRFRLSRLATAIIRYEAQIAVVDPWNEMDHTRPRLTEYVGFAIRQFRKLAKKYNVHLIVVAHPAKMQRNKDGKFPCPGLSDISDAGHWSNKAEVGIVIHRADLLESRERKIRVVKSCYHDAIGTPGEITGVWEKGARRYPVTGAGNGFPDVDLSMPLAIHRFLLGKGVLSRIKSNTYEDFPQPSFLPSV
jgi:twinkle protein